MTHPATPAELIAPAILAALLTAAVAIIFERAPELKEFLNSFTPDQKRLFMSLVNTLAGFIIGGIHIIPNGFTGDALATLGLSLFTAFTANQTAHKLAKT